MSESCLNNKEIAVLTSRHIHELKQTALSSPMGRARLCLHKSHDDQIQEMIVVLCKGTYIRPHRHFGVSESLHVIDGQIVVLFFDELGAVTDHLKLGGERQPFLYRLADKVWHTVLALSDVATIHEAIGGPFRADESRYASWSPVSDAPSTEIMHYMEHLRLSFLDKQYKKSPINR